MRDKDIEAVEKILGEPVLIEFSDYTLRIRTHLFSLARLRFRFVCLT